MAELTKAEKKKILDAQRGKDITKLSDSELQQRLGILNEFAQEKPQFDPNALKNEISGLLVQNGIPPSIADEYAARMGTFYAQTGTLPTSSLLYNPQSSSTSPDALRIAGSVGLAPATGGLSLAGLSGAFGGKDDTPQTIKEISRAGSLIDPLLQALNDKISGGGFNATLPDYSQDISSTQQLLDQRNFTAENQKALDDFLGNTPAALEAERNRFAESQKNRAQDYIAQVYAPQAAAGLNQRGLLDTESELGGLLGSKYADAQGQIEAERLAQQQSDIQFFADMSYKTTYQNLINQGADIRGQLNYENASLAQKQQQQFQTSQRSIDNRLSNDLLSQENQRQVLAAQRQADQNSKAVKDQFAYNLGKTAVTGAGAAVGAAYGGPAGAYAGQSVGNALPSRLD